MNKKWIMYLLGFGALYLLTKKKSVDSETDGITPDVGNDVNETAPRQSNITPPNPIVSAPLPTSSSAPSLVSNVDSPFKY
jgi:hypothetical protein